VRIPADAHEGEIEQPSHLEIVWLSMQETQKVFDRSFRVRGPRISLALPIWEQADVTRRALGAVVHSGLVQVRNAQRFFHSERSCELCRSSSLEGLLIVIECAIHAPVIGMELSQGEVGLHHIEGRSRGARGPFFWRQEVVERSLGRCQRLAARLTDRGGTLVPVVRFGKRLEDRLGLDEPAHVNHIFHTRARGQG
jgi:hypothetical protein